MWLFLLSLFTANAMPNTEFSQLTSTLSNASFSDDKLRVVQSLPSNTSLTISQSIGILEEFSFASDQLQALRIIAPYILERDQQYLLIETFTFFGQRQSLIDLGSSSPSKQIQRSA